MTHACLGFVVWPAHQEKGWWPRDGGTAKSAVRDAPAQRRPIGVRKRLQLPDATTHARKAPGELPLAEPVTTRNTNYVIGGGGGSHRRTRLRLGIPCFAGKYREILPLEAGDGDPALTLANKFKAFPPNSLRIETGNFAD